MTSYYTATNTGGSLPDVITGRSDFPSLADECEADIVRRYTRRLRRGDRYRGYASGFDVPTLSEDGLRAVYLRYYEVDADDVDDSDPDAAAFLAAFRRELVRLIRWRAAQYDEDGVLATGIVSERRGERSVTYSRPTAGRSIRDGSTPPDFGSHLAPFDLRTPTYAA